MRTFTCLCSALALFASTASTASAQLGLKLSNSATTSPSVEVKNNPTVVPTTGLTVEAWMTFDETSTRNNSTLIRHTVGSTGVGSTPSYNIRVEQINTTPTLVFKVRTATVRAASYRFTAGEFKNWTHVAGTYDGQNLRIFINGVEKGSNTQSGPIADQGGDLSIGSGGRKNDSETWNGEIDEVRLWPYARTAAEIQSTMNLALSGVPGEVSTWGLDFNPNDSSGGNNGANHGSPTYAPNTLKLTGGSAGAVAFGKATAGCAGTPAIGVSGVATPGTRGFAAMCVHAATDKGVGFFWIGTARLTSPIQLLGADLWVDTTAPGFLFAVAGDPNGLVRFDLPIPAAAPKNVSVYGQMVFAEPGCAVPLFASGGLTITTR